MDKDRRIITPEGEDRSGVDDVVVTASIGRPLRTVLIGLVPGVSIASGLRAIAGTYTQVVETITLDDSRSEEELLNAIVLSRPDLIFITGGMDDGAGEPVLAMAQTARMAVALMKGQRRPSVLYAGNSALIDAIRALFDGLATLFVAPNVRPSLDEEELEAAQLQLALAFDASAAGRGAGFEAVGAMSRLGVLPTAQSYNLIVDYLGQAVSGGVVALDIGSNVGTLAASLENKVDTVIRTDLGLGYSAPLLLETVGDDMVRGWLPFNISRAELQAYALNKNLRPAGIPETLRELYIEYALLRAAARALVHAAAPVWDPSLTDHVDAALPTFGRAIVAGAAITSAGRPGLSAMLALDALQPTGVTELLSDPQALIPVLGALAHLNPAAVVQVLDTGGLERLGTAISLSGQPRAGQPAMRVKITFDSGQTDTHTIDGGGLWVYALPLGVHARVEAQAVGRGVSIGGKNRLKFEVQGGVAGLIVDTRGRPLVLARDAAGRAAQLPLWLSQVTGDPLREIDPRWLEALPEADEDTPAPLAEPKRRRDRREKAAKPPKERAPAEKAGKGRGKPDKRRDRAAEAPAQQEEADEVDELRNLFS
jgi:hypothetical protein